MNNEENIREYVLTCSNDYLLKLINNQILTTGDVIWDDFKESPICPLCSYSVSIYKDKLKQQDLEMILNPNFGIYQIEIIFEDGSKEILIHEGGINKSKELTRVSCDDKYVHIEIELEKKGNN